MPLAVTHDRCAGGARIMAILNMTPDSFSGDGRLGADVDVGRLVQSMKVSGADIVDIGGESTRPGYIPVPEDEELSRVLPAIRSAAKVGYLPISVDTSKSAVAKAALLAGASIVNDASGLSDPRMAATVAAAGAELVLVHNRPIPPGEDVLTDVLADLRRQIDVAEGAGVKPASITVDPGLGLSKSWRENFEILRRLRELRQLGKPILVGPSRKGMIGRVLGVGAQDRIEGTLALIVVAIANGASVVRVHDVVPAARAARMMKALTTRG